MSTGVNNELLVDHCYWNMAEPYEVYSVELRSCRSCKCICNLSACTKNQWQSFEFSQPYEIRSKAVKPVRFQRIQCCNDDCDFGVKNPKTKKISSNAPIGIDQNTNKFQST